MRTSGLRDPGFRSYSKFTQEPHYYPIVTVSRPRVPQSIYHSKQTPRAVPDSSWTKAQEQVPAGLRICLDAGRRKCGVYIPFQIPLHRRQVKAYVGTTHRDRIGLHVDGVGACTAYRQNIKHQRLAC